jgi:ubiquinone/menaquinone biosynthesis C-methylase UbiE
MTADALTFANEDLIPPVDMLYDGTSTAAQYVAFGEDFVRRILVARAGLKPSDACLDVGCGNGSVAYTLATFLEPPGRYEGVDVKRESVIWLQDRYRDRAGFAFKHVDAYNKMYNPQGSIEAGDLSLPAADESFDVAWLKSVFTHMMPDDVRRYLSELARVLRPGGRAVVTYFLLNRESRSLVALDRDEVKMKHSWSDDPLCRVASLDVPERAVAHDEERIRLYTARAGLSISEVGYGSWCGRPTLLGLQDHMILTKPA